ncbi:MAG: AAA family ATPase [Trueperaceae bacterium]
MTLQRVGLPAPGGEFPWSLPLLRAIRAIDLDPRMTLLVGENGSGKSTLLEALALAADLPTAGTHDLAHDPTLEALRPFAADMRLAWTARSRRGLFLRAEDYFGYVQRQRAQQAELRAEAQRVAHEAAGTFVLERLRRMAPFLGPARAADDRYGGDLDARSHGESFLAFFRARLGGRGLYLLDEPEAALSPLRQLALVALLREATERGAQFVIATHAPILMAFPGATILQLADDGVRPARFDDLEAVRTLRAFLADPEGFVRRL